MLQYVIPIAHAQNAAVNSATQESSDEFLSIVFNKLPFIGVALVIMLASFFIGRFAKRAAQRALVRTGKHEAALSFVGKTVYVGCVVIGMTVALKITGIDISFMVGAVGFGLGFGLKSVLENYIAGLMILVQEPFHIGDMVKVGEHFGRVEQIEARATFIRLFDGQRAIVPNADMTSTTVTNFSTFPERRLTIEVGVSYDSDMSQVIQVLLEAFKSDKRILETPPPIVTFCEFADSGMVLQVRFWIDHTVYNWLEMTSVGCQMVRQTLGEHGINIPFPIRTLSMNPLDSDDMYKFVKGGQDVEQPMPVSDANQQN